MRLHLFRLLALLALKNGSAEAGLGCSNSCGPPVGNCAFGFYYLYDADKCRKEDIEDTFEGG